MLDGADHRQRKDMFMSLMGPPEVLARITQHVRREWTTRLRSWAAADRIVLLDEVHVVLCAAVCAWAGVPVDEARMRRRAREFAAMVEGAGSVGPRNWRSQLLRRRTERWARRVVEDVRSGVIEAPGGSAADVIGRHREPDGRLLDTEVAAVELINVLRPTVAVARFVAFAALALHEHPQARARLEAEQDYLPLFVQEVRRYYPFFPAIGGRVREPFEWRGHRFGTGTWVLLDLYGTDHDPRTWQNPEVFDPERFRDREESPYSLIPQGGGDHYAGHRCAGEWLTIEVMQTAVRLLTTAMSYDVPAQDLRVDPHRMPAKPRSGLVLTRVRDLT